ncbi:ras-related protein rabh1b-like [Anaeramoeba flamelloides]|uniref:Ras-related protein rabh1b-like n=1 Tax=Anaeramoeba flamelloides TaxID=1746091 RepID=A0AAV7YMR2_9EUKA|nr:ras-related protein rabh1b-like [Anaeramoeba flamelloides]
MNKYKIIFLGDEAVGKSSIITRFIYETFDPISQSTLGVDFLSKTIHIKNKTIRLQLWDTDTQSFDNLDYWLQTIKCIRGDEVIIVLVGNKADLVEKRKVSIGSLKKKAQEKGFLFFETSAKTGQNIKPFFRKVALSIMKKEKNSNFKEQSELNNEEKVVGVELEITNEKENKKKEKGGWCC